MGTLIYYPCDVDCAEATHLQLPLRFRVDLRSTLDVARLLAKHKNLHFLTSHANPIVKADSNQPWVDLFDGGPSLAPRWKALFVKYPDRFILNFDNVWVDHWGDKYVRQAALWRKALGELPAGVASKIAHENAEQLWGLPTAR